MNFLSNSWLLFSTDLQAPYIIYIEVLAHDVEEDLELQEQYHENLLADHYRSMSENDPHLNGHADTTPTTSLDRVKLEEGLSAAFDCGYSPESSEYDGTLSVCHAFFFYNSIGLIRKLFFCSSFVLDYCWR